MTDSTNDVLDRLWKSAANTPTPEELDRMRPRLLERLRRERRLLALRLGASGAALALLSTLFLLSRIGDGGRGGAPGWATALLLAPAWIAFALFVRRLRRDRRVDAGSGIAIRAALGAALKETEAALFRVRAVAGLQLASMPLLALALAELRLAGKVAPAEVVSLAVVLGGLIAVSGGWLLYRSRRVLRPRARRLESLLAAYD
jgi:hypothetical protein